MKGAPRDQHIADVAPVVLAHDTPLDVALKIFKRRVERAGIIREVRDRAAYRPPGARRRLKSHRARTRAARAATKRTRAFTPPGEKDAL